MAYRIFDIIRTTWRKRQCGASFLLSSYETGGAVEMTFSMKVAKMERTICELFAGVGGFRLGFERDNRDWRTTWFSQWEPGKSKQWAHDCYLAHFGPSFDLDGNLTTNIDIAQVDKAKIPDHNLLVGGFPCQDYSVARPLPGAKGIEGKKGVLWWQIRDTLEAKGAAFGLFENVDRLLKSPASKRGRDFGIILACLNGLGYSAEWRVVNAADYGAAQRRRRTFIFAYKNTTQYAQKLPYDPWQTIRTFGLFAKAFPAEEKWMGVSETVIPLARTQEELHTVSETFEFNFENAGLMRNGRIFTAKVEAVKRPPIPLREILEHNVGFQYYIDEGDGKWQRLKGAKKIERTAKNGHTYIFSEGAIAFPDSVDMPARTMLTSESSLNRSTHVITDPETGRMRLLTPNEADRIQGFVLPNEIRDRQGNEKGWTDAHLPDKPQMPEKFRYFCMGNALVVPMITRIAKVLRPIIDSEPERGHLND